MPARAPRPATPPMSTSSSRTRTVFTSTLTTKLGLRTSGRKMLRGSGFGGFSSPKSSS